LLANLTSGHNLAALEDGLFDSAHRAVPAMRGGKELGAVTLNVGSFPYEIFGSQPDLEWKKRYGRCCYHPLGVILGETGRWLDLRLRPGKVHTADGAANMLLPLVDRVEEELDEVAEVRGDAGFVGPDCSTSSKAQGPLRLPAAHKPGARAARRAARLPPGRSVARRRILVPGAPSSVIGRRLGGCRA